MFFAAAIQVTQIRTHQGARRRHFARVRQQVDVEMRGSPGRGRNLAPAVADHPPNETARARIVARVTPDRAEKKPDVLPKGVELVPERLARTEQIPADLAVDLEHE